MRLALLSLAVLVAGCSHMHMNASSASFAGTSTTSTAGSVQIDYGGPIGALILGAVLISAASEDLRDPPRPDFSVFSDGATFRPPPMDPSRAVNEQDCTKPIQSFDNLKCK